MRGMGQSAEQSSVTLKAGVGILGSSQEQSELRMIKQCTIDSGQCSDSGNEREIPDAFWHSSGVAGYGVFMVQTDSAL